MSVDFDEAVVSFEACFDIGEIADCFDDDCFVNCACENILRFSK